jgi:hypothetical protein
MSRFARSRRRAKRRRLRQMRGGVQWPERAKSRAGWRRFAARWSTSCSRMARRRNPGPARRPVGARDRARADDGSEARRSVARRGRAGGRATRVSLVHATPEPSAEIHAVERTHAGDDRGEVQRLDDARRPRRALAATAPARREPWAPTGALIAPAPREVSTRRSGPRAAGGKGAPSSSIRLEWGGNSRSCRRSRRTGRRTSRPRSAWQ